MVKNLLIVESPAKAKTINKYLGSDYKVLASMGHVRSLVPKDGSIDVDNGFEMKFETLSKSSKSLKEIVDTAKNVEKIMLAPDPDREGEAIAWHILEVLKQKKIIKNQKVERITYNEITKKAVEDAIKHPRQIDDNLVDAQQARQALDYLVGFTLSPVLWRKLPGSKSAGRVQSVALRLVCDREDEIEAFKKQEYWTIDVDLKAEKGKLTATLTHINGKKLDKFTINNEKQAKEIEASLKNGNYKVLDIEKKQTKRNPYPPFTTSTLQQEASKKLGFSAKQTMSVAQKLYEAGHITYMRTDGVYTAPDAIQSARDLIKSKYGDKYLPPKPILYQGKSKNAQEAHEAIRPTHPENIGVGADTNEKRLYDLIWKRLIASQMEAVVLDQVGVNIITDNKEQLRAVGTTIKFDGFYVLWSKNNEEEEENNDDDEKKLPEVKEGEVFDYQKINTEQHWTEPPARYSEASLVKKMEELGIGRPSTYATILSVIQEREYVKLQQKRFFPEERGRIVTAFLKEYFKKYVEYDYTAKLEENLDEIADGKAQRVKFLGGWWKPFKTEIDKAMEISPRDVVKNISVGLLPHILGRDDKGNLQDVCPMCKGKLELKFGKFGAFVACSNYPECKYIKNVGSMAFGEEGGDINKFEPKQIGEFKGENVYLKKGPYGFYIQVGENVAKSKTKSKAKKDDGVKKPKLIGVPKTETEPENFTFEKALFLLNLPELPRNIGKYENKDVLANKGRFGPYLSYDGLFCSVKNDDIYTIKLDRAIEIIKEKQQKVASTPTGGRVVKKKVVKK
ncbi:MAG: type I DNA topoisomerase [Rickettsiales bacterium]|nr:MAG: type I DNA topoisomerase [Rickettsiales bacterium]